MMKMQKTMMETLARFQGDETSWLRWSAVGLVGAAACVTFAAYTSFLAGKTAGYGDCIDSFRRGESLQKD